LPWASSTLRAAVGSAERGKTEGLDAADPLLSITMEREPWKTFQPLYRHGQAFWTAILTLPRDHIGEVRRILKLDDALVDAGLTFR
jgi:hypothetical protein